MGKAGDIICAAIVALAAVWAVVLFAAIFGGNSSGAMTMTSVGHILLVLAGVLVSIAFYFLPTLIAAVRDTPNAASVAVVNLFLGWTFIGWVVALAMAVSGRKTRAGD